MLNWTRSVEAKKEESTGKVEEADNVKLEDEEDQDDVNDCQLSLVNDCQLSLIYHADHVQPICPRMVTLTT
jgi:hypothetical protein